MKVVVLNEVIEDIKKVQKTAFKFGIANKTVRDWISKIEHLDSTPNLLTAIRTDITKIQQQINQLSKEMNFPKTLMFNGTNLLVIHAPNFKKYALKVALEIFTTDELVNCVILEENEKK